MAHSLPEDRRANILRDIVDSRRYESRGGYQKFLFMQYPGSMRQFSIPSNEPFTTLMHDLHETLNSRYTEKEQQIRAKQPVVPLPSFVTETQYEELAFKHDVFIKIIEKALDSPGWPADDHAIVRHILRSNSDITPVESGSSW